MRSKKSAYSITKQTFAIEKTQRNF
jgi:hypothetical protein